MRRVYRVVRYVYYWFLWAVVLAAGALAFVAYLGAAQPAAAVGTALVVAADVTQKALPPLRGRSFLAIC